MNEYQYLISAQQKMIESQNALISALRGEIAAKDKKIEALREAKAIRDLRIEQLESKLEFTKQQMKRLRDSAATNE